MHRIRVIRVLMLFNGLRPIRLPQSLSRARRTGDQKRDHLERFNGHAF